MTVFLPKLLITGANGQLGSALVQHPLASSFQLIPCTRDMLDLTHMESIHAALKQHRPDFVVNAAAYTAVDKAESEPDLAQASNHDAVKQLAIACREYSVPLLHVSTDYVFDGNSETSYSENDTAHPINVYGLSKWQGENAVRQEYDDHIILRVSAVFSEYGHNFLKTIQRLSQERTELKIVDDQISCPTYAGDIASAIFAMVKNPHWGTYHFCGDKAVSWYDFACFILDEQQKQYGNSMPKMLPIPSSEYPTPAKRPLNSILNCLKFKQTYPEIGADWQMGVINALCKMR